MIELSLAGMIGSFLVGLTQDVVTDLLASRADQHLVERLLDHRGGQEVRRALRKAWNDTVRDLFKTYRRLPEYSRLAEAESELVGERERLFLADSTIERLFPLGGPVPTQDTAEASRLLSSDRRQIDQTMFKTLEKLGLFDGLPGGLQSLLERHLLDGLTFHFVENAIQRDEKARDSLFFESLMEIRRAQGKSAVADEAFREEVRQGLRRLEGYRVWNEGIVAGRLVEVESKLNQVLMYLDEGRRLALMAQPVVARLRGNFEHILNEHRRFGGRRTAREAVARFFAEPAGFLFLEAPSGYGKTALLAQIVQEDRESYQYHFFSRRNGLVRERELQINLAQQLLALHNVSGRLPEQEFELRGLCIELLRTPAPLGKPVRIVIDALDEADFDLKPYIVPLGTGVHVLLSARPIADRDWMRDLSLGVHGAERLTLGPMDRDEIRELFAQAGSLPVGEALVADLELVTEGDPFFLRVLLDDFLSDLPAAHQELRRLVLTAHGNAPRPEEALTEGLRRYLERWWSEIADVIGEQQIETLLGYLAVSLGPLTRDELIHIRSDDALRGSTFDRALKLVHRFLTGESQSGYSLCHPRFRAFVAERMRDSLENFRAALIGYCESWEESWKAYSGTYALRFYADHLRAAERFDGLYVLARNTAFLQTQGHWAPENPYAALRTIKLALERAIETEDAVQMATLSLAHARQAAEIARESPLKALRVNGGPSSRERAWVLSARYGLEHRTLARLLLGWELQEVGRPDEARALLERLQAEGLPRLAGADPDEPHALPYPWEGELAALVLARTADLWTDFPRVQSTLLDPHARRSLCKHLVDAQNLSAAAMVFPDLPIDRHWANLAVSLDGKQMNPGALDAAELQLEQMESGADRALAWLALAQLNQETERQDAARNAMKRAEDEARHELDRSSEASLFMMVFLQSRALSGDEQRERGLVQEIRSWENNGEENKAASVLLELGRIQVSQEVFEAARHNLKRVAEIAARIGKPAQRVRLLMAAAEAFPAGEGEASESKARLIEAGLENAQQVSAEDGATDFLIQAGLLLSAISRRDRAAEAFAEAVAAARRLPRRQRKAEALAEVASAQAAAGYPASARKTFALALQTAARLPVEDSAKLMAGIALEQARSGLHQEAERSFARALARATSLSEGHYSRAFGLIEIANAQLRAGFSEASLETRTLARKACQEVALIPFRDLAMASLAASYLLAGQIREVMELAQGAFPASNLMPFLFGRLIPHLLSSGLTREVRDLAFSPIHPAQPAGDEARRIRALAGIAGLTASLDKESAERLFVKAEEIAGGLADPVQRLKVLWEVGETEAFFGAPHLAAGSFDRALRSAQALSETRVRTAALRAMLEAQLEERASDPPGALILNSKHEEEMLPEIWAQLLSAVAQAKAGEKELANALFASALEMIRRLESRFDQAFTLVEAGLLQAQIGDAESSARSFDEALRVGNGLEMVSLLVVTADLWVQGIWFGYDLRTNSLPTLQGRIRCFLQANRGEWRKALETARDLESRRQCLRALEMIAALQAGRGLEDQASVTAHTAHREAKAVEPGWDKVLSLLGAAAVRAAAGQGEAALAILDEAAQAAETRQA